jgi:hypothetical protein
MAETSKTTKAPATKAKAPAKPRATAVKTKTTAAPAKKQTVAEKVKAFTPSHDEIAQLARKYWADRGWQDGQAEQDWLRAEQELMQVAS